MHLKKAREEYRTKDKAQWLLKKTDCDILFIGKFSKIISDNSNIYIWAGMVWGPVSKLKILA